MKQNYIVLYRCSTRQYKCPYFNLASGSNSPSDFEQIFRGIARQLSISSGKKKYSGRRNRSGRKKKDKTCTIFVSANSWTICHFTVPEIFCNL